MRLFRGLFEKVDQLFTRRGKVDDELFDELEELLIQADLSMDTTMRLVDGLRDATRKERLSDPEQVKHKLEDFMVEILGIDGKAHLNQSPDTPNVYLVVGVNGVGKTTTIAKLAHKFKKQGKRVMLAAADTFRAAAIDQLEIWANRVGVEIIKHQPGADPAAVVFDSMQSAKAR
jgi:fused signal recognition particle receptor